MQKKKPETSRVRLLRAIECLQLIQRTNPPESSIAKAAAMALKPLLREQANQARAFTLEQSELEQSVHSASAAFPTHLRAHE